MSDAPKPSSIIPDGAVGKLSELFPGKFVFVYVADHEEQRADVAFTCRDERDIKLGRLLLARATLGETSVPKDRN